MGAGLQRPQRTEDRQVLTEWPTFRQAGQTEDREQGKEPVTFRRIHLPVVERGRFRGGIHETSSMSLPSRALRVLRISSKDP
ncbi:hypothetical protein GWK47_023566 [Chionoecetes opilio]|uniref:Uncharacterized protein n=1 Tax=Chionoecetes opilio TaxID=41210 RepID=A0A8J4XME2_CHIOP|nr:hypothetical protein GWK47_023566 [Chionoecetes opilio]